MVGTGVAGVNEGGLEDGRCVDTIPDTVPDATIGTTEVRSICRISNTD